MQQQQQQQQGHGDWYWVTVGYVCILLGSCHMVLSAMYFYWFGVAVGFSLAKIGFTALGMTYVSQKSQSLPWILKVFSSWGSNIVRKLFTVFRWPMFLFGIYVCLCIAIRIESRDSYVRNALATFPKSCDASAPSPVRGCNRVKVLLEELHGSPSETNATNADLLKLNTTSGIVSRLMSLGHGKRGEISVHVDTERCTSVGKLAGAIKQWTLQSHAFSRLVQSTSKKGKKEYMHFRILSTLFGFADDFMIQVSLNDDEKDSRTIVVEAQGQLRLGVSDLHVNAKRNNRLIDFIENHCSIKTVR